jgi:hypothetical protein
MDADSHSERPRIAKLTGVNYRPWALQVKRYLQALGLWEVVVYSPGIDFVVTGTPGIGTEEKPVITGGASGSSNTAAESTGFISPGGKQGEHQIVDLAQFTEIYDAKAATLIIGFCSSIVL